jgi:hypothetical protein
MRYFFDIVSDRLETVDAEGCELESDAQMRQEATRLLAEIVAAEAPYGIARLTARVRDGAGRQVYRTVLSIEGQRLH